MKKGKGKRSTASAPYVLSNHVRRLKVKSQSSQLTVVDLFAGAGGLSEGFRQAGYRVIGGSDIDPDAAATYSLNFPEAESICGDIRTHSIREGIETIARQADVIVGGSR